MPDPAATARTQPAPANPGHSFNLTRWQERGLLAVLSAVQFNHIVDFMLVMPLGPQLMRLFEMTPTQFGILVSAYSFSAAIFGFFNALYVDRMNRKTVLLIFFALFAVATIACGLAPGYTLLLIARAAAGAFGGSLNAIIQSIIGDVFPPERRGAATGVVASAFALASVAGVPIAVLIAASGHWQYPFLLLGVLCVPVWILARRVVPDITGHVSSERSSPLSNLYETLSERSHQISFAFGSLLVLSGFSVIPYISPYQVANVGITDRDLAWIYLVGGAATFFTQRWFGRLSDRHGKQRVFMILAFLSMAPIVITTHFPRASLWWVIPFSTLFFVLVSGRFVPAMAMGVATMLASAFLSQMPNGEIAGYGNVGWFACAMTLATIWLSKKMKAVS